MIESIWLRVESWSQAAGGHVLPHQSLAKRVGKDGALVPSKRRIDVVRTSQVICSARCYAGGDIADVPTNFTRI